MDERAPEHVGRTIDQELRIEAEARDVYDAWADPEKIARWFVDAASGECKSGGVMTWRFDSMHFEMPVPIFEAVPGEKIVIAGEIPGRPPFLQEVFIERAGGATRLRLLNSGFGEGADWDDEYEGVDSGWKLALATLKHVLESHASGRRTHVFRMRPTSFEYERLRPLYFEARGLASWLGEDRGSDAGVLRAGSELALELGELGALEGRVIAASRRELLVTWPARRALLGIKAFAMGGGARAVALDFNAWSDRDAQPERVGAMLDGALDRLCAALAGAPR